MAKEISRKVIGDTARFALDIRQLARAPADVRHLGWANLFVWFKGVPVWAVGEKTLRPVTWTWLDLAEWLGRAWQYILFEENAPFGLVGLEPRELLHKKPDEVSASDFEQQLWAYQQRHDLSAGLKGLTLPALWLFPEAKFIRVRVGEDDLWVAKGEVIAILEEFVSEIFALCAADDTGRAALARQRWEQRMPSAERVVDLRSGLSIAQLKAWLPDVPEAKIIGDPFAEEETSFMAAARLSASLPDDTRLQLLQSIASLEARQTPELDRLTRQARPMISAFAGKPYFEQGYKAALWLRGELENLADPVDSASLLEAWGVTIAELPELDPRLDAVAVWGKEHGPAILINPAGHHNQSVEGRRATLAHEIAHLLLDRGTHLPAGEVFGGTTPASLEKRARAFAAEFLLPREVVSDELSKAANLEEAFHELRRNYQVSNELLAWQIWNGPAKGLLTAEDMILIDRWRRMATDDG